MTCASTLKLPRQLSSDTQFFFQNLFFLLQCRFARLKRETSSLRIIFYGGIVVCAHQKFCCLSSCSLLCFSLPLISAWWPLAFSHFLTAAMKFSCFSSNENRLLCFYRGSSKVELLRHDIQVKEKKENFLVACLRPPLKRLN